MFPPAGSHPIAAPNSPLDVLYCGKMTMAFCWLPRLYHLKTESVEFTRWLSAERALILRQAGYQVTHLRDFLDKYMGRAALANASPTTSR